MRFDLRVTLVEASAGESPFSKRPLIRLKFQPVCQPGMPPIWMFFVTDHEFGRERREAICTALGVSLPTWADDVEVVRLLVPRYDTEVILDVRVTSYNGHSRFDTVHVRPLP